MVCRAGQELSGNGRPRQADELERGCVGRDSGSKRESGLKIRRATLDGWVLKVGSC